jgi:hypothetical protein
LTFVKGLPTFGAKAIIGRILGATNAALIKGEATSGTKARFCFIEVPAVGAGKERYGSHAAGVSIF